MNRTIAFSGLAGRHVREHWAVGADAAVTAVVLGSLSVSTQNIAAEVLSASLPVDVKHRSRNTDSADVRRAFSR